MSGMAIGSVSGWGRWIKVAALGSGAVSESVTTALDTARKRGEDLFGTLMVALGTSPAHPGLLLSQTR